MFDYLHILVWGWSQWNLFVIHFKENSFDKILFIYLFRVLYTVSSDGTVLSQEDEATPTQSTTVNNDVRPSFEMNSVLKELKCQGAGITVSLYNGSIGVGHVDKKECMCVSHLVPYAYM